MKVRFFNHFEQKEYSQNSKCLFLYRMDLMLKLENEEKTH